MISEKKIHFKFGSMFTAYLVLNSSRSNLFLTLLDFYKKVIIVKTSGCVGVGNSKRKKLSSQVIDNLISSFLFYFKLYKVENFILIIKRRMNKYLWTLTYKLKYFGFNIKGFILNRRIPHNGMRIRKQRRR